MAGRFRAGQSGNPGGRPKALREVTEAARAHTEEAIERLAYWMRSKNPKASIAAANALLDRGWGKPAQFKTIEMDRSRPFELLTDDELLAIAALGRDEGGAPDFDALFSSGG